MDNVTKEEIQNFLSEEFPNSAVAFGNGWWHVQAGTLLGTSLHYEYVNGEVVLHNECVMNPEWWDLRNYLRDNVCCDSRVEAYTGIRGRYHSNWKLLGYKTNDWERVKEGFRLIKSIFQPYIMAWEIERGIAYSRKEQTKPCGDVTAYKTKVLGLLTLKNLCIPEYQRPYRWTEKNVMQLLQDINASRISGKLDYMIGSVILHDNIEQDCKLNIVDGQQRITTICLILKALAAYAVKDADIDLPDLKYNHSDSFIHIRDNYQFIKDWIEINIAESDRKGFTDYLLRNCKMMQITVKKLTEAFQLFETQNGRGKPLEAYNLLKAYHIRAMSESPRNDKVECDVRWEEAALFHDRRSVDGDGRIDLLKQVINEHLYRIRLWSRGSNAYAFSRKEVDEFKGLSIGSDNMLEFAYQNILLQQQISLGMMQLMNSCMFKIKSRFEHGDPENMSPFVSINQLMCNGKTFFDYIETYVEVYKRLFVQSTSSQLAVFKDFYQKMCKYPGCHRSGDGYLRQVYKSAVMLTFDRFGEKGVLYLYEPLYLCLYQFRLKHIQVKYQGLCKNDAVGWIFTTIQNAKSLTDLSPIKSEASRTSNIEVKFDNVPPEMKAFFKV